MIRNAEIKEVTPDPEKAKSLRKMAERTLDRIEETDVKKYPTQVLKDYYNVIHCYLEAISLKEGKKVSGRGAHAELISFICDEYGLDKPSEQFLQNLRKYRNRISYEGFFTEPDYIDRNESKIKELIEVLREISKDA